MKKRNQIRQKHFSAVKHKLGGSLRQTALAMAADRNKNTNIKYTFVSKEKKPASYSPPSYRTPTKPSMSSPTSDNLTITPTTPLRVVITTTSHTWCEPAQLNDSDLSQLSPRTPTIHGHINTSATADSLTITPTTSPISTTTPTTPNTINSISPILQQTKMI